MPEALKLLEAGVGSHFDPRFAMPFFQLLPRIFVQFGKRSEDELKPHLAELRLRHFGV
jgi:hypothetical protein